MCAHDTACEEIRGQPMRIRFLLSSWGAHIQVARFAGKNLYPLSHLTCLVRSLLLVKKVFLLLQGINQNLCQKFNVWFDNLNIYLCHTLWVIYFCNKIFCEHTMTYFLGQVIHCFVKYKILKVIWNPGLHMEWDRYTEYILSM